jgi:uncharacterized protein YcfJ
VAYEGNLTMNIALAHQRPALRVCLLGSLLGGMLTVGACGSAFAVEFGHVLSATPVMQQVAVPRQVCSDQQVEVQQPKSGAGAAIGAIAGGALGSASGGRGGGRAAATVIGAIGGAMLGERLEGSPEPELRTVRQCGTQTTYENRAVAYNVVYEYAGKQYTVQMPHDPGPKLALQIGPVGASNYEAPEQEPLASASPTYSAPQTVYAQPQTVYAQAPVVVTQPYPVYYTRPYYPPIALEFGFGNWGGYRGGWGGHRHWR